MGGLVSSGEFFLEEVKELELGLEAVLSSLTNLILVDSRDFSMGDRISIDLLILKERLLGN